MPSACNTICIIQLTNNIRLPWQQVVTNLITILPILPNLVLCYCFLYVNIAVSCIRFVYIDIYTLYIYNIDSWVVCVRFVLVVDVT